MLARQPAEAHRCLAACPDPRAVAMLRGVDAAGRKDFLAAAEAFLEAERFAEAKAAAERYIGQIRLRRAGPDARSTEDFLAELGRSKRAQAIVGLGTMRGLLRSGMAKEAARVPNSWRMPEVEALRGEILLSLGEWGRAGKALLDGRDLARAREAFEKAGDERNASRARAMEAEESGDLAAAGAHWHAAGVKSNGFRCQARAFEAAGEFRKAAECYEKGRMTAQARRCRQRIPPDPTLFDIAPPGE